MLGKEYRSFSSSLCKRIHGDLNSDVT
jgi:hypothetical protein